MIGYKAQEYRNSLHQIYSVHRRGSVRPLKDKQTRRPRYLVLFIVNY